MGLRSVSLVMWVGGVDADPAYLLLVRKLSLAVKVRSHTLTYTHTQTAHPSLYLPDRLSTPPLPLFGFLIYLFFYLFSVFSLSLPHPVFLPWHLLSLFLILLSISVSSSPSLPLYLSPPDVRLLFTACYTCTAYPCPHKSHRIPWFFYLEE